MIEELCNPFDTYNYSEETARISSICRTCKKFKKYTDGYKKLYGTVSIIDYPDEECFYGIPQLNRNAKRFIPENCDSGMGVIIEECDCYEFEKDAYRLYLDSNRWKKRRREIIEKSGCKCSICGYGKNLEVHHINYARLPFEDDEDLICVCKKCHKRIHERNEINDAKDRRGQDDQRCG